MAVRQDQVQLRVDFITDESRALANTLLTTKQYNSALAESTAKIKAYQKELEKVGADEAKRAPILAKISAEEQKIATNLGKIATEGKKVEGLDLNKVAPAQLVERAKQLEQAMKLIPQSAPAFRALQTELAAVNGRLATIRSESRGVAQGLTDAADKGSLFKRALSFAGGLAIFDLAKNAVRSLFDFGRAAISTIDEQLKADAQVAAAIKSTNGEAGRTFEQLQQQASDLQKVTLFGDEQTAGAQALLLTFRNIKGEVFDNTIPLLQDLSTALGQDLKSSSIQVGKALNDPVKGITALQRVGITFTDDQKKLIKSLVDTGDVAGAQRVILKELETQVGGSARAAAEAGAGPYQLLAIRFGEIQESIGLLIRGGLNLLKPVMNATVGFFESLTNSILTGKEATGEYSTSVNLVRSVLTGLAQIGRVVFQVFQAGVPILLKIVEGFLRFANTLIAIPGFINENRAAIGSLVVALVSLNASAIATEANTLRMIIANRAATIAAYAQATAQRVLNFVLSANPIGLVVAALSLLAGALVTAYEKSETFRRVVTGVFAAVTDSVKGVIGFFSDLGSGLSNLFTGNFQGAADAFGRAFQRIDAQKIGADLKKSFVAGYESVKTPQAQVKGDIVGAMLEGKKLGAAVVEGEKEGEKDGEEKAKETLAERRKKALDARIKEIEVGFLKEELVADRALFKKEISEAEHAKRILLLKQKQYLDQIAAFKAFHQEETKEALDAQKKLLEIQQSLTRDNITGLAPLGAKAPGQVTSQTASISKKAAVSATDDEIQINREKLAKVVDLEQNNELLRLEMLRNFLNEKLQLLRENNLTETTEYDATLAAKIKADEDYQEKKIENEKRTAELKRRIEQESLGATSDFFGVFADLLAQDEKARKRNAGAIKAFQTAQVIVDGIQEVQKIWATSAQLGPIAGPVIGAILTAVAVGRTVLAISKINSAKFARGGTAKFGYFGGQPHSAGGTKGYFDDGTRIEVERGEAFAVVNKQNAPMLSFLSRVNTHGGHGDPFFEHGGLMRFAGGGLAPVNTNPIPSISQVPEAAAAAQNALDVAKEIRALRADVAAWNTVLRANVVYQDVEDAGTALNLVRDDAAI